MVWVPSVLRVVPAREPPFFCYEWTRSGIDPQINNAELRNLPVAEAGLTDWMRDLASGHPIVAVAKKIRDDRGSRKQIEAYIRDHSDAEFSHGLYPDFMK